MSDIHFWMFGNAFLLLLDIEAILLLGLHLWFKRKQFKLVHMVSLAFFIYLVGQMLFRALYWELWREVGDPLNIRLFAEKLLLTFHAPLTKAASLVNMIGLIMIVMILTWSIRHLWIYAIGTALIVAFISIWF